MLVVSLTEVVVVAEHGFLLASLCMNNCCRLSEFATVPGCDSLLLLVNALLLLSLCCQVCLLIPPGLALLHLSQLALAFLQGARRHAHANLVDNHSTTVWPSTNTTPAWYVQATCCELLEDLVLCNILSGSIMPGCKTLLSKGYGDSQCRLDSVLLK